MIAPTAIETPAPKKSHKIRNIGCGGAAALLVLIIAVGAAGGSKTASTPAAPDTAATQAAPPAAVAPPTKAPKAAPAAAVLLDLAGTGTKSTQKFTVGGNDWDLVWSFDCAKFGTTGNFIVENTADAGYSTNGIVNQLGANGAGVEHYHTGGTYFLSINSECGWHVTVKG